MSNNIILIDCPDEKGLVYNITKIVYDYGLNIISNQEFVDIGSNYFFMRTVVENNGLDQTFKNKLLDVLPEGANVRLASIEKKPIVILATKEPHCLGDLLLKNIHGEIPSDVRAVVSNHDNLQTLANSFNVPFHHISSNGVSREDHEERLKNCIDQYSPDYLVLAKYMRIFTPDFVSSYQNRIINIHHSFLPAFAGASPYKKAYERGVKIIGATSHFVTNDLDEGPIIAQNVIPINHTYTADGMTQAGRDVEKNVLSNALKLVLEEKVFIYKNRTVLFE